MIKIDFENDCQQIDLVIGYKGNKSIIINNLDQRNPSQASPVVSFGVGTLVVCRETS